MSGSSVTIQDLRSFHSIDRKIYSRLVINLGRDLIECMYVLALWLWLEEIGYPNLVLKLLTLPDRVLNLIADEAVLCLRSFQSETPPPIYSSIVTEIPVTEELMEDRRISVSILHEHRARALQRITHTVTDVWPRAFNDITEQALANGTSSTGGLVGPSVGFRPAFQPPLFGSGIGNAPPPPAAAAGIVFPSRIVNPDSLASAGVLETGESSQTLSLNPMAEPWNPSDNSEVPPSYRTMFITFSRGYPITERELRDFLIRLYGSDCIEELYMQDVSPNKQPLYARVVFRSARTIAAILDGKEKAKFSINGKHVWARLYVEKHNHSAAPPVAAPEDT